MSDPADHVLIRLDDVRGIEADTDRGVIRLLGEGGCITHSLVIGPGGLARTRHFFALGLGICEAIERTGVEVVRAGSEEGTNCGGDSGEERAPAKQTTARKRKVRQ